MRKELYNAMGRQFLTIEYDIYNKWVYNNWIGYQTINSIIKGANTCLEYIEEHKCAFVLNDNRLVSGPWNHSNEWIAHRWMPRAVVAGMRFFAHVVNAQTLAEISAGEMHQNANGLFTMQVFNNYDLARTWLKSTKELSNSYQGRLS